MPRFRSRSSADLLCDIPLSPETIRWLVGEVSRPCHFFVGPNLRLEWEHCASEESVWEIFQGRLLDPAHTRLRRTFEAWNIYQRTEDGRSGEPLLSVKWVEDTNEIHVVRGIDSYVNEGYDSGGGVFLTRERRKWVRELVGTADLTRLRDLEELRDELICLLFNAVVGTSRLPLAPVETPLPTFSFGDLYYCFRSSDPDTTSAMCCVTELLQDIRAEELTQREQTKRFETFLHALPFDWQVNEAYSMVPCLVKDNEGGESALLQNLFLEVSLSPYTDLIEKCRFFVRQLDGIDNLAESVSVDFFGHLLRQNTRHLTAYDLITFHHHGANYPDALLLDGMLKDFLLRIEFRPDLFRDRLRRRGLRQAWLLRRTYEGHLVPDMPTSPGEHMRVLPSSHPRVSEEQIVQPAKRKRRLFENDPLTNHLTPNVEKVLRQSLADLEHPDELRELGMAIYLDRPLNYGKPPAEPDGTLLFSAEAFSRNIALQRLHNLPRWFEPVADAIPADCVERLQNLSVVGLPLERIGSPARPGVISLTDARLASPDFVFLRTTRSTVNNFLSLYDVKPLAESFDVAWLTEVQRALFARAPTGDGVIIYDGELQPRFEIQVPVSFGYERRAGHEYPRAGLWVIGVWLYDGEPRRIDLCETPIVLKVR